ncbi:MAG: phosphate ABC transporter substrate-binding protein [Opitutus sp.]|nr:phosphate ABC transporter substrate-binding protein [Opitutus sp.]MCS6247544.1 phosphate ABC transporter substrate-binding protein [Opitutus sp.]MCS6274472.1 phosphate ABC transporter substrate-binding protein [Opitutus sp.]MCS6277641.1 phosphate ABC transporter substrate-binding protein [Opitutus sp.]MCS6300759.1 phosphate ABC transporter substrate-binding protein [Opitutus sp.]
MNKSLVILAALLASVGSASAQKLVIKGSDTLGAKLVPTLAEEYKAAHPGVSFEIAAEGSTTGITAITDGTAAIGMSSRRAKATEMSGAAAKGVALKPTIVCYDCMAVIVNEKNPLTTLTKKQVEQVFTGDVSDWSAIGGTAGAFSIYTRNTSSGTYSDWKDLAMKKRDYAPSSQKMAGNEQIAAEVGKNVNGIGYVGVAYIHAPGIKVVSIEGSLPTKDEVLKKTYPYARPTFYYTNGEPTGEAAKFIAFTHSDAGQKIVEKVGFIPVK